MPNTLSDARVQRVLTRLHRQGRREMPSLVRHFFGRILLRRLVGQRLYELDERDLSFLRNKLIPLDPDKCRLCYLLGRAIDARRVVEVGTSFGVSTIYLAAAVADNIGAAGGTGVVVGTEIDAAKAARARDNFAETGLDPLIELRVGDARETLEDAGGLVDLVLIDSWVSLAQPILQLLTPQLRPGAIVLCDNVRAFAREYRDYLDYVRNPANGFCSTLLPHRGGLELSVFGLTTT
jgi:predicted O-methyltransferase YrrM